MAEWVWEARPRAGELRKGTMDADDKESVNSKLRAQNLSPLKVKKKGKRLSLSFGSPVTDQEIVVFIRLRLVIIPVGNEQQKLVSRRRVARYGERRGGRIVFARCYRAFSAQ